jgi:hypothetical protein
MGKRFPPHDELGVNAGVDQEPVVSDAVGAVAASGPGSGLPKLERAIGQDFARFLVSALSVSLLQGRRGRSSP